MKTHRLDSLSCGRESTSYRTLTTTTPMTRNRSDQAHSASCGSRGGSRLGSHDSHSDDTHSVSLACTERRMRSTILDHTGAIDTRWSHRPPHSVSSVCRHRTTTRTSETADWTGTIESTQAISRYWSRSPFYEKSREEKTRYEKQCPPPTVSVAGGEPLYHYLCLDGQ